MRADGTRQRRLTSGSTLDGDPAWSPDGRHIAFVSRRGIGATALFTMRADGTQRKRITKAINADNPSWAPDGRTITFDADLVSQAASGAHVNVYSVPAGGSASPMQLIADASDPAWSPDGSRLAFVTDRQAIAAVPAAGGTATQLVAAGRHGVSQPAWQPLGRSRCACRCGLHTAHRLGERRRRPISTPASTGRARAAGRSRRRAAAALARPHRASHRRGPRGNAVACEHPSASHLRRPRRR
jgi:Tol biopolymer transport system component